MLRLMVAVAGGQAGRGRECGEARRVLRPHACGMTRQHAFGMMRLRACEA